MPALVEVALADEPAGWEALGFAVDREGVALAGGVALRFAGAEAGEGIIGWRLRGEGERDLDGLATTWDPSSAPAAAPAASHPNGVVAVDHVVALTDELDRTIASLDAGGVGAPRRVREAGGGRRQAFYVLDTALLELAGPVDGPPRARFWGLTLVAADLDALAERLEDRLGPVRDAVQPGRRIATLRPGISSAAVAFMTPRDGGSR